MSDVEICRDIFCLESTNEVKPANGGVWQGELLPPGAAFTTLARLHLYTESLWWEFLYWQDCIFILNVYDRNSYIGKTASLNWMFMMGIPILTRLHLYTECLWWEFLYWQDCICILNVYDGNSYTGKTASVYWMFIMGIPILARPYIYTETEPSVFLPSWIHKSGQ